MPPARLLLQPDGAVKPGWAVFDPIWYLRKYGATLPAGVPRTPSGLLEYYLRRGGSAGHSPSPLFDETYYCSANPNIAALIKAGRYSCGFEHYCELGHRFHAGHWLFDEALYGSMHADMALENLDAIGLHGRYDHYLRFGQYEHRLAHPLFDSRFYAAQAIAAGDDSARIDQLGPFTHFLYRLQSDATELPPSIYFDPAWYKEKYGHRPAIAHYLRCAAEQLDPVPEFSEAFYRNANADVRAALQAGNYASGYRHFLQAGVFELRPPSPAIDLAFYRDANAEVRDALNTGAARDAFAHLRGIGLAAGLPAAPLAKEPEISEAAAKQLFIRRARDQLAVFARRSLDFTATADCALAVIIVMFEKFELTMLTLSALRLNYAGGIQLILVDNGSSDATKAIEHYVTGARIIRLNQNIGYLRACNLALQAVRAERVLFLNNDVEFGYGAVDAAIARLDSAADIGAVGAKIIRSHGVLQEAGCIIWQDGSTSGYMRDAPPLAPEANFVREVDFCSGVFLLCRAALVKKLGGFDADFSPAYYEEADLCVRMAGAGYRILYDPAITVYHLEYGSADDQAARALMQRGEKIFRGKHAAFLQSREVSDKQNITAARTPRGNAKNILFIEDIVPLRRLGSGYARANDIVRAIAAGHAVSVFPVAGADFDVVSVYSEFPDHVEVLHDRDIDGLSEFLASRTGFYQLIWVSRSHNLARVLPLCLAAGIDPASTPFVLDTEAVATTREAARARLAGIEDFDFEKQLQRELEAAPVCRHCIAVNDFEAGLLRRTGLASVSVLGTMRRPDPTPGAFSVRDGLLFAASIHQPDSPNLDALRWFVAEILPALMDEMENPPILNFAGHVAPEIDLAEFAGHPQLRIHGPVASLRPHYEQNRVFIAPTRFAAGTPYKLYEAASFGVPIVATTLLAGQLNWRDGAELLAAPVGDAKRFAAQIARLYRSPRLWARLRNNALGRIAQENTPEAFNRHVATILDTALRATSDQMESFDRIKLLAKTES